MIESFIRELENEIQQLFPMGEACSNQKTYLEEVDRSTQKPMVDPDPDPISHFGF